jgi:hypothetical protein
MTLAKSIRFTAVLVVLAGHLFVVREGERRIGARLAANAELAEQLSSNHRLLALRAGLERERTRLRAALRAVGTHAERGAMVSGFLRDAAAVAAARGTRIVSVTANGAPAGAPAPTVGMPNASFDSVAFELAVEGRYADVLATARDLSATSHALASVEFASLARKSSGRGGAALTASLNVVLHRLGAPAIRPMHGAQPAPSEISDVRTGPA